MLLGGAAVTLSAPGDKTLAGRSVSRILCGARPVLRCRETSERVRPARRGDHSSGPSIAAGIKRPTRGSKRAGPALPSYLALLHAGFAVPPMSPSGRWALTPPFHPCLARPACGRRSGGFSSGLSSKLCGLLAPATGRTGGIFSVALSVAAPSRTRPPGVTRRAALPSGQRRSARRKAESGLSSNLPWRTNARRCKSAITRPTRHFHYNGSIAPPQWQARDETSLPGCADLVSPAA